MKLFIPDIGDKLVLSKDWTFTVYNEHRNRSLFVLKYGEEFDEDKFGYARNSENLYKAFKLTLPAKSILKIDRIYIRKGASEYSSISCFIENQHEDTRYNKKRFWAKLIDVNNIEIEEAIISNKIFYKIKAGRWSFKTNEEYEFLQVSVNNKHTYSIFAKRTLFKRMSLSTVFTGFFKTKTKLVANLNEFDGITDLIIKDLDGFVLDTYSTNFDKIGNGEPMHNYSLNNSIQDKDGRSINAIKKKLKAIVNGNN